MMRVAYQGEAGAFGHQACLAFLPDHEPIPVARFADVLAAVEAGKTERGVLPLENSIAGPVEEVSGLLATSRLPIIAEHMLPIRMHLLGLPGAQIEDIRVVTSHPMALGQCRKAIETLGLRTEKATNTALAARALAESGDRTRGVLASEAAALTYGLEVLRADVHDRRENATRFAIFAREEAA